MTQTTTQNVNKATATLAAALVFSQGGNRIPHGPAIMAFKDSHTFKLFAIVNGESVPLTAEYSAAAYVAVTDDGWIEYGHGFGPSPAYDVRDCLRVILNCPTIEVLMLF